MPATVELLAVPARRAWGRGIKYRLEAKDSKTCARSCREYEDDWKNCRTHTARATKSYQIGMSWNITHVTFITCFMKSDVSLSPRTRHTCAFFLMIWTTSKASKIQDAVLMDSLSDKVTFSRIYDKWKSLKPVCVWVTALNQYLSSFVLEVRYNQSENYVSRGAAWPLETLMSRV